VLSKKILYFCTTASLLLVGIVLAPALQAADNPGDSQEVTDLLSQAKTQAIQLRNDADDMEAFTRSNVSWESHASKITEIKQDVNKVGETVTKLNQAQGSASAWQKTAIERITPLLQELAANTEAIINHLNREQGRLLNTPEHRDLLKENAELSARMAAVIGDFVDYGATKAKFEELSHRLEVSER